MLHIVLDIEPKRAHGKVVGARSGATAPNQQSWSSLPQQVVSVEIHDYSDPSDQSRISALEPTRGVVRNARLEGLCGNKRRN
jgi:hypothetical protein